MSIKTTSSAPRETGGRMHPPGTWWLRAGDRLSILLPQRILIFSVLAVVICVLLAVVAIGIGGSSVGFTDVIEVLTGRGRGVAELVIVQWRMPRILLAIAVGIALGVSGAIFQTLTRNPLASPDLIGSSMGAQTGILVAAILLGGSFMTTALASLIGGLLCGSIIFFLAFRGGFASMRLIVAGIAISAMLGSLNRWLMLKASSDAAYGALRSSTGSLVGADWALTVPTSIAILALLLLVAIISRPLQSLDLGVDMSKLLGVRVSIVQGAAVLLGTALVALATMGAGPITFLALASPHLARLITRASTAPLAVSGAVGAVLLLGSDVAS